MVRFRRPEGGELRISTSVLTAMLKHVQRHQWSREAGGVLLGRMRVQGEDVDVTEITTPGPRDRRSRFRFFRAQEPAQSVVKDAWERSDGQVNYLGEWHTHPQDDPEPSSHDRAEWRRLVKIQTYEQSSLFFVIVGRKEIRAWELAGGQQNAVALVVVDIA
jgi:integrative and conjugative element protein (TIGR02256 family)